MYRISRITCHGLYILYNTYYDTYQLSHSIRYAMSRAHARLLGCHGQAASSSGALLRWPLSDSPRKTSDACRSDSSANIFRSNATFKIT